VKQLLGKFLLWSVFFFATTDSLAANAVRESPAELRIGVLPYMSTERLMARYTPLRIYLQRVLQRPVRLMTAPTFASYLERARHYEYDLYLTAPHFAVLAETESQYQRVSHFQRELDASFVVLQDAPVRTLADLKGKRVTTPDSLAIVTAMAEDALRHAGLEIDKTVEVVHAPSHNAAVLAVANGQSDAAVVSSSVFESMSADIRARVRVLDRTPKVPNIMFMASPKSVDADYQAIKSAMENFGESEEGKAFFLETGYIGMAPISDFDMDRVRPYANALRPGTQR